MAPTGQQGWGGGSTSFAKNATGAGMHFPELCWQSSGHPSSLLSAQMAAAPSISQVCAALSQRWGRTAWAWPAWCLHLLPAETNVCMSHLCPRPQPWLALTHPRPPSSPPRCKVQHFLPPLVRALWALWAYCQASPIGSPCSWPSPVQPRLTVCSLLFSLCLDLLSLFLPVRIPPVH